MSDRIRGEALSFDDVLLIPARAALLPADVEITTRFSRNIPLNIPLVSAAMDMVTKRHRVAFNGVSE